jgi:hypothetical protein
MNVLLQLLDASRIDQVGDDNTGFLAMAATLLVMSVSFGYVSAIAS